MGLYVLGNQHTQKVSEASEISFMKFFFFFQIRKGITENTTNFTHTQVNYCHAPAIYESLCKRKITRLGFENMHML